MDINGPVREIKDNELVGLSIEELENSLVVQSFDKENREAALTNVDKYYASQVAQKSIQIAQLNREIAAIPARKTAEKERRTANIALAAANIAKIQAAIATM